eukprot:gene13636-13751_t
MKQTPKRIQPTIKRLNKFKKIGLGFLVGMGINLALADIDMKPTVEEYDKHESGIARLILGGGGVWSLARTFHAGGFAPLGLIVSLTNFYLIRLYKRYFGKGQLQAVRYWFFPQSPNRLSSFPPSYIREFISYWVEGNQFSPSYIEEMSLFFVHLLLDVTESSISWQGSVILRYVIPESYGALKAKILDDEKRLKKEQLSLHFKATTFKLDASQLLAEITGDLISYVGSKKIAQASQVLTSRILTLSENQRLEIAISSDSMNRIAVTNDRISQIFGDEGTFVSQADENTGQLFIKPSLENGSKPLSITFITENGVTQDLILKPTAKSATTTVFNTSVFNTSVFKSNSKQKQLLLIMRQLVAGQLMEKEEEVTHNRSNLEGFELEHTKSYQAGPYSVQVFSVQNTTSTVIELKDTTLCGEKLMNNTIELFKRRQQVLLLAVIGVLVVIIVILMLVIKGESKKSPSEAKLDHKTSLTTGTGRINPQEIWVHKFTNEAELTKKRLEALPYKPKGLEDRAGDETQKTFQTDAETLRSELGQVKKDDFQSKAVQKINIRLHNSKANTLLKTTDNTIPAGAFAKAILLGELPIQGPFLEGLNLTLKGVMS